MYERETALNVLKSIIDKRKKSIIVITEDKLKKESINARWK